MQHNPTRTSPAPSLSREGQVVIARPLDTEGDRNGRTLGYYALSTAPETFEGNPVQATGAYIPQMELIDRLCDFLGDSTSAHIVIHIHGFNNPPDVCKTRVDQAYKTLREQSKEGDRLVFLGYDWPSEKIGQPGLKLRLAPPILIIAGLILAMVPLIWSLFSSVEGWKTYSFIILAIISVLPALLLATAAVVILLRWIVYFRDQYRATHYGVVDLVELIRRIDSRLSRPAHSSRVSLSFVGHSMGAFVTINTVRILTDVFKIDYNPASGDVRSNEGAEIGHSLQLENLVLVSPDLPTENILSGRSNYVATSLRRFKRCFLFSNEADEVVNLIAKAGHTFALPYGDPRLAVRMANLSLNRHQFGVINRANSPGSWADHVWTTEQRLSDLDQTTNPLIDKFTLVDCTDAVDQLTAKRTRKGIDGNFQSAEHVRVLSPNLPRFLRNRNGHFKLAGHIVALCTYIWKYDLHSGYFDAKFLRSRIFGFASSQIAVIEETEAKSHQLCVLPGTTANIPHAMVAAKPPTPSIFTEIQVPPESDTESREHPDS